MSYYFNHHMASSRDGFVRWNGPVSMDRDDVISFAEDQCRRGIQTLYRIRVIFKVAR